MYLKGSNFLRPIKYVENLGSHNVKLLVMLACLNTPGEIKILAKKSRNHTELMYNNLNIPISIKVGKDMIL